NEAPIDAPPQNDGVIGAAVHRGKTMTYVVASASNDGAAGATMTYGTPGDGGARHVVFDAPEDASGKSTVTATAMDGRCVVTITPGGSFTGHPLMFAVSSAADGCKAVDDPDSPPASAGPGDGIPTNPSGDAAGGDAPSGGGCGCMFPRPRTAAATSLFGLFAAGLSIARKNGRRKK
ncbi:MAG: hypothetical protein ACXWUG_18595, partial [Polyangiales bacterium]